MNIDYVLGHWHRFRYIHFIGPVAHAHVSLLRTGVVEGRIVVAVGGTIVVVVEVERTWLGR